VPGTQWHAGSVTWVSHGSYIGWYPCPPRGWSHAHRGWHSGYRHGYHNGYHHGYDDGWRDAQYANWVEWGHLGHRGNVSHHVVHHDVVVRHAHDRPARTLAAPPTPRR
jgi:hypothetical protein